jgi:nucleoside-diphosphate-sugar epimerase
MKKVLIAGGAGYIGTLLVNNLKKMNYDVTVVDMFWFGNFLPDDVKVIKKNIIDLSIDEVEGYDSVVYIGGISNDPMANYSPSMNFIENISVPVYLAFITKESKVKRFIFASSCSVYGYTKNNAMNELSETNPQYPYGISKLSAENAILNLMDKDFHPIILRKGTVGGYSHRMRFDLVVNTMTKTAIKQNKIVVNNPSIWRPLIDIRDAANAYILSIEASLDVDGVFNISENNYTMLELATEIKQCFQKNGHSIDLEVKNISDVRNYKVSNKKAREYLNFYPEYKPIDSVNSIIENMDTSQDLNSSQYYNIEMFKELF